MSNILTPNFVVCTCGGSRGINVNSHILDYIFLLHLHTFCNYLIINTVCTAAMFICAMDILDNTNSTRYILILLA